MALASIGICLSLACNRQTSDSKAAVDGSLIYASACARCHSANGCGGVAIGSAARAQNFCDADFQGNVSDQQLMKSIKQGRGMMPAFGDLYNDEQIAALVRHLRSFKPKPRPI
jgi:mono/diheme cytochrome c family protein